MNVQQRQAWFVLKVAAVTVVAYVAALAFLGFRTEAFAALGLFGFSGFTPLIGRKEQREGGVVMDERDLEIARCAGLGAFSIAWLYFCAVCMAPLFIKGPDAVITIPATTPPMILLIAMVIVFTTRALVTIAMYRRGNPRSCQ